ncbi:MAG: carboxylesterase family protein [Thermoguttaceae bacterium]
MWRSITCCVFVLIVLLSAGFALAADAQDFLESIYTEPGTGLQLPYQLFVPTGYDPSKEYPMVVFLHGAGESGTDNLKQINGNIDNLLAHVKMSEYSSFLLAPQTNSGWAWWGTAPSDAMRMTLSVMQQLEGQYNVDQSRLYLTGLSMGGFGTWEAIWQNQGLFAAAVPICGGGDTSKAPLMVDQPIWAFHNDGDPTVPVEYSREMIAAIRAAGGDPLYTEYHSTSHNAWKMAYNEPELYDWMYSQAIPEPGTWILLASAAASLLLLKRRRRLFPR